jgi:hypothetical protein
MSHLIVAGRVSEVDGAVLESTARSDIGNPSKIKACRRQLRLGYEVSHRGLASPFCRERLQEIIDSGPYVYRALPPKVVWNGNLVANRLGGKLGPPKRADLCVSLLRAEHNHRLAIGDRPVSKRPTRRETRSVGPRRPRIEVARGLCQ